MEGKWFEFVHLMSVRELLIGTMPGRDTEACLIRLKSCLSTGDRLSITLRFLSGNTNREFSFIFTGT